MKPMLAATIKSEEQLDNLIYPLYATHKYDGVRLVMHQELGAVTRELKPIPNVKLRELLNKKMQANPNLYSGLDGEIIVKEGTFQQAQSMVMTREYAFEETCEIRVFDRHSKQEEEYSDRVAHLFDIRDRWEPMFQLAEVQPAGNASVVKSMYSKAIEIGLEGLVLRGASNPYKFGRSTLREQGMIKYKPIFDAEAIILDLIEKQTNNNEAIVSELGYAKRSSHKDNKTPANTLGALVVEVINGECSRMQLKIGTGKGLTDKLRKQIWDNSEEYIWKTITFEYAGIGSQGRPRHPSFKGFRDDL